MYTHPYKSHGWYISEYPAFRFLDKFWNKCKAKKTNFTLFVFIEITYTTSNLLNALYYYY